MCVCVCVCACVPLPLICRLRLDSHLLKIFFQTLRNLSPSYSCSVSHCQIFSDLSSTLPLVCCLSSTFTLICFSLPYWVLGHRFPSHRDVLLPLFIIIFYNVFFDLFSHSLLLIIPSFLSLTLTSLVTPSPLSSCFYSSQYNFRIMSAA